MNCDAETCWLHNLLHKLLYPPLYVTLVYCDNTSAVYMSTNLVQHQRTDHILIDIPFVCGKVVMGQMYVLHVSYLSRYVDIFIKRLPSSMFLDFISNSNVRTRPPVPNVGGYLHIYIVIFISGTHCAIYEKY